jgi:hypothetical protein
MEFCSFAVLFVIWRKCVQQDHICYALVTPSSELVHDTAEISARRLLAFVIVPRDEA